MVHAFCQQCFSLPQMRRIVIVSVKQHLLRRFRLRIVELHQQFNRVHVVHDAPILGLVLRHKRCGRVRCIECLPRCVHAFVAYAERRLAMVRFVLHFFGHIIVQPLARRRVARPQRYRGIEARGVNQLRHGHAQRERLAVSFRDADARQKLWLARSGQRVRGKNFFAGLR